MNTSTTFKAVEGRTISVDQLRVCYFRAQQTKWQDRIDEMHELRDSTTTPHIINAIDVLEIETLTGGVVNVATCDACIKSVIWHIAEDKATRGLFDQSEEDLMADRIAAADRFADRTEFPEIADQINKLRDAALNGSFSIDEYDKCIAQIEASEAIRIDLQDAVAEYLASRGGSRC